MSEQRLAAEKTGAARLSVVWNVVLMFLKVGGAVLTGSVSMLSEAIHAVTDTVAAGLVFYSVRAAERPPDPRHPFGHGKWENISGTVEAVLVFVASVGITWEAVRRIIEGARVERLTWAMAVLLLASVGNWWLSNHLFRVGARTDSVALEADGHNLRVDVYTSLGVLIGLALVEITGAVVVDSVVAIGVGLLNTKVAWNISRGALGPLLDIALPEEEVRLMDRALREDRRVLGYHKLRTRRAGPFRHVDVHLFVADQLSVGEAHDVAEKAENRIREALPGVLIVTHVEPWSEQSHQEQARSLRWREQG
ncbi:MAG: cation transporter [Armatimonadetes bacterium]|nr:cation transporter [Armatimonadota bacterium]